MIKFFKTQHLIEAMVTERVVPGVNYAIINGPQIFRTTMGFASIYPKKTQLSPFAEYDLASLTKVLATENVLLQLYDQGKLNFTEPVHQFIPAFSDQRVRLFHLLTHTSGIRGWIPHRDQLNHDQLLQALIHLPVTSEFGKKMRYADTNFILLGLVIKKIYHEPVQNVATEKIFKPMHLHHTTFYPSFQDCVPTAIVNQHVLQGIPHDPKARQLKSDCGSAGLFSNLDDLLLFAEAYLGRKRHLLPYTQTMVNLLFSNKNSRGVKPRSWGWDLRYDPKLHYPIILHAGFTGTLLIFDRFRQTGLILLTNRVHPSGHNTVYLAMRAQIIKTFLVENSQLA